MLFRVSGTVGSDNFTLRTNAADPVSAAANAGDILKEAGKSLSDVSALRIKQASGSAIRFGKPKSDNGPKASKPANTRKPAAAASK